MSGTFSNESIACGAAVFLGLSLAATTATNADSACDLQRIAELPAKIEGGHLLIETQIDGHDTRMAIGMVQSRTLITRRLTNALNLRLQTISDQRVLDEASQPFTHSVFINELKLGQFSAKNVTLFIQSEAATNAPIEDGTIGQDFLKNYDVEFDILRGKISLYLPHQCKAPLAYWTTDFVAVPLETVRMLPTFPVMLDGHEIRADLNTAIENSTIDPKVARETFQVDPENGGSVPDGQVITASGATIPFYRHRFSSLEIGTIAFHNTEIGVISDKALHVLGRTATFNLVDVLNFRPVPFDLGLHQLSHMRFLVSNSQKMIYVSAADAK